MATTYEDCTPCCIPSILTDCCEVEVPQTLYVTVTGFKVGGMTPTDYTWSLANNTGYPGSWQVGASSTFTVSEGSCSGDFFLYADLECVAIGGGLFDWYLIVGLRSVSPVADECYLVFDATTVTCNPFYLEAGTPNAGLSDNDCCTGDTFDYTAITISA